MKYVVALLLSLLSLPASAQFDCIPKEYSGDGLYLVISYDPFGRSAGWYCPDPTLPPGLIRINTFTRLNSPGVLPTCNTTLGGALDAILTAHKPLDVANAMLRECGFKPPLGTPERFNFDALEATSKRAVQALYAADHPPPPPAPVWVTVGTSVYLVSGGRLGAYQGRTSLGLACDCTKPLIVGLVTYCPFTGAAPNTVASCGKKP